MEKPTYTAQYRYEHDPEFHAMVDMIHSLYLSAKYTPTELREAVMLAAVHYETTSITPRYHANPNGSVTVWDRSAR